MPDLPGYTYDAGGNRTEKDLNGAVTAYVPEPNSNRLASVGAASMKIRGQVLHYHIQNACVLFCKT